MEKKTNKAKLEIFKFLRKSAESAKKLAEIVPSMEIQLHTLLGYFCMQNSYLR